MLNYHKNTNISREKRREWILPRPFQHCHFVGASYFKDIITHTHPHTTA